MEEPAVRCRKEELLAAAAAAAAAAPSVRRTLRGFPRLRARGRSAWRERRAAAGSAAAAEATRASRRHEGWRQSAWRGGRVRADPISVTARRDIESRADGQRGRAVCQRSARPRPFRTVSHQPPSPLAGVGCGRCCSTGRARRRSSTRAAAGDPSTGVRWPRRRHALRTRCVENSAPTWSPSGLRLG